MKFSGIKQGSEIQYHPFIQMERQRYLSRFADGSVMDEELTPYRNPKTTKQLGAHFGLMLAMACAELDDRGYDTSFVYRLEKPTGNQITKDILKDYLYQVCPIFNSKGQKITLSKANTAEASKHFEDCRNFMASQWQIVVPEPNADWRKK